MPEYLAPGVFVEEVSFRAKSIEGVSTSTTGFVGPTRRGPGFEADSDPNAKGSTPELLTSFLDFQRIYGGLGELDGEVNYLAHAVRAYFDNGGARLFVARCIGEDAEAAESADLTGLTGTKFKARFSGSGGNGTIAVSVTSQPVTTAGLAKLPPGSLARHTGAPTGTPPAPPPPKLYLRNAAGKFMSADATPVELPTTGTIEIVTVSVVTTDADGVSKTYDGMGLSPDHPRYIGTVMSATPTRRSDELEQTYALITPATKPGAIALFNALAAAVTAGIVVEDGEDGTAPGEGAYRTALAALAGIEDISIVAAPGSSESNDRQSIHNHLITHCEQRRAYRIAVLDTRRVSTVGEAKLDRAPLDSTRAALYTPWVIVDNPLFKPGEMAQPREIAVPPSGAVCGIYARTDVNRGVFKAPANEVVRGALRHDLEINFAQQETLNPIGINCLRFFPNRGNRVWGARTISSDPEWKYVNIRRYFNYLERSIDVGTQWAVFEPNGERLWANIRETVSDFLISEWRSGALLGTSPKEAFFVRCDRSTMDQNDLDNGRLICLVGVAVVKPAEFVIFRVGQKTVDARN